MKPTKEEVAALIDKHGFKQHKQVLLDVIEPAVYLVTSECDEDLIELGATKFGGLPDIPEDMAWPMHEGMPLAFLAQIRLSDLPAGIPDWPLPATGRLSFWYEVSGEQWGYEPDDAGAFRVVLEQDESSPIARRPWPKWPADIELIDLDEFGPYAACKVAARLGVSFAADLDETLIDEGTDSYARLEAFDLAINGCQQGKGRHRLLGQPDTIQGDMALGCQLVTKGAYSGNQSSEAVQANIERLTPGAADWQLLLQFDSDEEGPEWMWGDLGCLYFWIRKQDLAKRNFAAIWCGIQGG